MVESCVERLRKPDKAIFDITLDRLGVSAEEAVFLDDIGGNLKTAKQMGMATIKVQKDVLHVVKSTCPMLLLCIFTTVQVSDISEALEVLEQILAGNPAPAHILGTSEVSEKLKFPVDRLVDYLQREHGLRQEEPPVIRQFKHGQSNPTYYVSYGGEEMVLRKKPVSERTVGVCWQFGWLASFPGHLETA